MHVLMSCVSRCYSAGVVRSQVSTWPVPDTLRELRHVLLYGICPRVVQVLRLIVDTGDVDDHRLHGKDELLNIIKHVDEDRYFIVVVITW